MPTKIYVKNKKKLLYTYVGLDGSVCIDIYTCIQNPLYNAEMK